MLTEPAEEAAELSLASFRQVLEAGGITVVSLDRMDNEGVRLVFAAPEYVADTVVGAYLGLHVGEAAWQTQRPALGARLDWMPGGLTAVKVFDRGEERYGQPFEVRGEWARRYLHGEWSMEDVLHRVRESVSEPRPIDTQREWGFD